MKDLSHKQFVVFGVANDRSICWSIVEALRENGARIVLVAHPVNEKRVKQLANANNITDVLFCDVADAASLAALFESLSALGPFHGIVHGIAASDRNQLKGRYLDTTRENFVNTMIISCFSLTEIVRGMEHLLTGDASIVALSFDASRGTYPNYNVMGVAKGALEVSTRYLARDLGARGIRVNVVSPSPEDTLSARGISNFRAIGDFAEAMSPLGRRAELSEVGSTVAFLLSQASGGINGQIVLVDCGASSSIMPPARNAALLQTAMGRVAELHRKENDDA